MTFAATHDSPRPRVGGKPPPGGADGGCPDRRAIRPQDCADRGWGDRRRPAGRSGAGYDATAMAAANPDGEGLE